MSSAWGRTEVAAFLARVRPDLRLEGVKSLSGGYWNDVLRLDTDQGRLVLKHYRAVMPGTLFPNLPHDEARALERLAGQGVAPDPVGFWADDAVLMYRYIEGAPWAGDISALAALLRRKEGVDPIGFRAVAITPEAILAEGAALFDRCADDAITRRLRALRPEVTEAPPLPRRHLIHTDIGAMNLIGAGEGLRLIDWQCPAAGDGAEDVYTALSPAFQILNLRPPLTAQQRATLLAALVGSDQITRLPALESAFAWRMAGYCCLRLQTADDPAVRDRYTRAAAAEADHIEVLR